MSMGNDIYIMMLRQLLYFKVVSVNQGFFGELFFIAQQFVGRHRQHGPPVNM